MAGLALGVGLGLTRRAFPIGAGAVAGGGTAGGSGGSSGGGSGGPRALLLVAHGQSNARSRGAVVTPPGDVPDALRTFNGGSENPNDGKAIGLDAFIALAPWSDPQDEEAIAPGFAIAAGDRWQRIVAYTSARGSTPYAGLMTGTGPAQTMLAAIERGHALLRVEGYVPDAIDIAVVFDHGEADAHAGTSGADYLAALADLRESLDFHVPVLTGHAGRVPVLLAHPVYTGTNGNQAPWLAVQDAHVEAHDTLADMHALGPKYAYAHEADGVHMSGDGAGLSTGVSRADEGKRPWGEWIAHRLAEALDGDGEGGELVRLDTVAWEGGTLTTTWRSPSGAVALDASGFYNRDTAGGHPGSSMGVELVANGASVALSNPVASGGTVTFDTALAASGSVREVRVARMAWPGGLQATQGFGADPQNQRNKLPRANVRDASLVGLPSGDRGLFAINETRTF